VRSDPPRDAPGVVAFPPLLYTAALGIGLLLHWLAPRHPLPATAARLLGAVFVVGSAGLARWGERTMRRAGTNVDPRQPALELVVEGPFRYSRNPLYLALTGLYLGITLLVNAVWPLVLLVPLLAILRWGVIGREERYLEAKFGEPYRAYRARVGRWL
jgi:protein-S-isoprenylcysteine O-methyltransferase Ste14